MKQLTKENYMAPEVVAIATNLDQSILDVSGTAGDLGDGGDIDLFGLDIDDPMSLLNNDILF